MKIAVIGGGSTYTPELVSGLSRERERVPLRELVLHDIDDERREVVGGLARRMLARQGYAGALTLTGDLEAALDGADFVLIQIRVGGQEARLGDETFPLACGCIGQETTGAGGLAKALRTVPVVLEIAERARDRAADRAWIVDFTNPVGIVRKNWRSRKIENASPNQFGMISGLRFPMKCSPVTSWSFDHITYTGTTETCGGSISATITTMNATSRPRHRSRESAYATGMLEISRPSVARPE